MSLAEPASSPRPDGSSRMEQEVRLLRASNAVGKAAKFGVREAVRTWGVAGTGARISELWGVAQESAILARIGGGAKALGGTGMAGGARRLVAVGAAPIVVVGGLIVAFEIDAAVRARRAAGAVQPSVDGAAPPSI